MRSLNEFAGYRQVFKDAQILPPFFETNLVDPSRVVKIFQNDPQGQIRIFYYQYLKLCFELQNVDYDMYIRKIEEIINNADFQFIFHPQDDGSIYNDTQAKSLIMQFFGVLGEGNNNVLQSLTKYPIMDKILVHFFRSLMMLSNVIDSLDSYIERDKLLNFLCETFDVQANIYGQCIRYTDTDIFVYQLNQKAIYMAYMDYDNYNNSVEESPRNVSSQQPAYQQINEQPSYVNSSIYNNQTQNIAASRPQSNRKEALAKDSYIADQFVDFTSNASALSMRAKQIAKQIHIDAPINTKIQIQKPVAKPQVIPTVPTPKQAPKIANLQPKQVFSYNTNSANTKPIALIQPISAIKQEVKMQDSWQGSNSFQNSYKPQALQSFEENSKYSSSNAFGYQSYGQDIPKINQPPAPVKDNFDLQKKNYVQNYQAPQVQVQPKPLSPEQPYKLNSKQASNDLIYNPRFQSQTYNMPPYQPSKLGQSKKVQASVTTYNAGSKKKPSGLNVSQQYTSSDISKYMVEPHRSNVENIKIRQRNLRSSLIAK